MRVEEAEGGRRKREESYIGHVHVQHFIVIIGFLEEGGTFWNM